MTALACIVLWLAERLEREDIVYLADDDQQAEALSGAVAALCPGTRVHFLPSSDALPGDAAPPSPANVGKRVATLHALRLAQQDPERPRQAVFLSGEAAARRYPHPSALDRAPPLLRVGDPIEAGEFSAVLDDLGYFADDRVDEPGEMAVRGEVIDIFPADAAMPVRIDIAEGFIAALRRYDPATQLSVGELESVEIGRAAEPLIDGDTDILAYFTAGTISLSTKADERRRRFVRLAADAAGAGKRLDAIDDDAWATALSSWQVVAQDVPADAIPRFAEARSPLAAMARFAKPLLAQGRVFVLAGSQRDLRFLRGRVGKRLGIALPTVAGWDEVQALPAGSGASIELSVDAGLVDDRHVLVAAADLLGSRALIGEAATSVANPWAIGSGEIRIGDVVVHEDHGVAQVAGLEPALAGELGNLGGEMIILEHAGGARRLVAVADADRIWRYGADADVVTLDKLDGSSWLKRRGAIDAAVAESARGLAALAEERGKLAAPVMEPDPAAYERFAGGFPFNETADQARAIAAVRDDLGRGAPMDRLIVGDVGYGKTEVALRAAAIAALSGFQVIVAAPTTVLVRQHIDSFTRRFAPLGIAVAGLSRLSTAAEKKTVKAGLADGSIQIVVGTGAVMAKDVRYAKLGLVVVDEEQRFGAADKVKLRSASDVHLLTLSATPIPRTLQMALIGLQHISIIATPPARRQPIRTSLDQYDDSRVRSALLREKGRGGQSFVVVPRIEDIAKLAERLRRIVPDLSLVEAHGKMPALEADAAMVAFASGQGDILLATNIIEAGLDVPRANTMIVWNADRFGLAQLHQLRGRVGRGNRRGQVVLLTDADHTIADRTMKRLRTLATFDRLGAGFEISAQDLDMRGGGDLLGETQAGHMKLIGIELYQHLLGMALRQARGEPAERWTPELNVGSAGALPESWIPEPDIRVPLYVRLARVETESEVDAFETELIDRFGPLPEPTEALLQHARLRLAACAAHISRVDAGPAAIALTPRRDFAGDAASVGLTPKKNRLLLFEAIAEEDRTSRVHSLLEALATG